MDCGTPGSSVHGILQARVLEWVAISFSRGSSRPGDRTCVSCDSCIGRQVLYQYTTGEACTVAFVLEIFTCSGSPWFGQNLFPFVWNTSPHPDSLLVILKAIVRVPLVTQVLPLPHLALPRFPEAPQWVSHPIAPRQHLGVAMARLPPRSGTHRPSSSSCLMASVCLPSDFSSFKT